LLKSTRFGWGEAVAEAGIFCADLVKRVLKNRHACSDGDDDMRMERKSDDLGE
jgi:hypothetical protein